MASEQSLRQAGEAEDEEASGELGLLREGESEEEHPPYELGEPARSSLEFSAVGLEERLQREVQERARLWGESVTSSYAAEPMNLSTDGETEMVPDYASMPSLPQTPQLRTPEGPIPQGAQELGVRGGGQLENLLQQVLDVQSKVMDRLSMLERERAVPQGPSLTEQDMQRYFQAEMARREELALQLQVQQEEQRRQQERDLATRAGLEEAGVNRDQGQQLVGATEMEIQPAGSLTAVPDVEMAALQQDAHPPEDFLSGFAERLSLETRTQVGIMAGQESPQEGQAVSNPRPADPPCQGNIVIEGRVFHWSVTSKGLRLVPSGSEPPQGTQPEPSNTSSNIFATRARSPFVAVERKTDQIIKRTPSPNRPRGSMSWSERRRTPSRSPPRIKSSTPASAPGGMSVAVVKQLFDAPGSNQSVKLEPPPGLDEARRVEGLIARFESTKVGSDRNVGGGEKRVSIQETTPNPQTPRTIKPTIIYPCSPGGTEIRPPATTPPRTPLTASPVQDTASAQHMREREGRTTGDDRGYQDR